MCAVVVQSEPFFRPVDCALLPRYTDYVYHPMDFSTLEKVGYCFAIIGDMLWWEYCDSIVCGHCRLYMVIVNINHADIQGGPKKLTIFESM